MQRGNAGKGPHAQVRASDEVEVQSAAPQPSVPPLYRYVDLSSWCTGCSTVPVLICRLGVQSVKKKLF